MQRNLVYVVVALLVLVGVGMVLSFTAGGVMFGLGCFAAALALWLLHRGVMALELSADLQAQGLLQRKEHTRDNVKGEDHPETTAGRSEAVREEPRPSQPVAAGD
jgi:multisubunit Na+/H+ antiporter MnhC subunit